MLVDLPLLHPWEESGGRWVRCTGVGHVVAEVLPTEDPTMFDTFITIDEGRLPFEGTAQKAMSVVDRHLEHHGFVLDAHYRCVGCGAMDEDLDGPCVAEGTSHHPVRVNTRGCPTAEQGD